MRSQQIENLTIRNAPNISKMINNIRSNIPYLFLIIFIGLQYGGASETPDLYSAIDDIIRLNSKTFEPTVFHKNKDIVYMVQFYNTFCGHCQMFAPTYKDLGSRVKNWTSVVRLAGIDCSKDENVVTCSENKIDGYPTILIYPPNARAQDPNDAPVNLRKFNIEWTVDDIEETIIDYVVNLTDSTGRHHPIVVDALQPISAKNLEDVKRIYPIRSEHDDIVGEHGKLQDLMVIVESDKSYLGKKLIVEYFRISTRLELRRILLSNTALLRSILSREEFAKLGDSQPVLLRLRSLSENDSKAQVLVRGEEKHILPTSSKSERQDFIYNRFKMFFEHFYSIELKEIDGNIDSNTKSTGDVKPNPSSNIDASVKHDDEMEIRYLLQRDMKGNKRIFAVDLLKGISYMLTHEVKIKGGLSPAEFSTVRNLLTIFKKYLPLENWDSNINKFIIDFRTRLDDNRNEFEKNGLTGQEMSDILDLSGAETVKTRYNSENWVACHESDRQHKGYTCSLWLMFHTLTVGEYLKAAPVRFRPTMVLYTMRDYITKFLGCTVCASNFEKETESLNSSLNNRNSSILWLWYTHNRVNQRLNNEKAPQDKKPLTEVIYPSHKHCPACIKSDMSDVGLDGKTLEDVDWDQTSVLDYLINIYRPDKVVSPIEMALFLTDIKSKINYDLIEEAKKLSSSSTDMNSSIERGSNFSIGDISLCLALYLACIMIVAIVCVELNPKWKRSRSK